MPRPYPPGCAYIEGAFVPMSEAKISVLDWGFLRSDATYDVVHVWQRRFFRLDKHIERFQASIDKLRLTLPFDHNRLEDILKECVRRSGLDDAYVEMVLTRGVSPTFSRDPREAENTFLAFAIPFGWVANEEQRARGLDLHMSSIPRISPASVDPAVKNYHWLDLIGGLFEAYDAGRETVVLSDGAGHVTEGPGFNLFMVKDGQIFTPCEGILGGISRATVLEIAEELAITAEQTLVAKGYFRAADEVFITSTAGGVMPVTRIDGVPVQDGKVGPITKMITNTYWEKHRDPSWTTPVDD